jgi:hypothetical protein
MWKWISGLLIIVLLISNGGWIYATLEWASLEKYRQQESRQRISTIKNLTAVLSVHVVGKDKEELEAALQRSLPGITPFEKEGAVHTTFISFPINDEGIVESVRAITLYGDN